MIWHGGPERYRSHYPLESGQLCRCNLTQSGIFATEPAAQERKYTAGTSASIRQRPLPDMLRQRVEHVEMQFCRRVPALSRCNGRRYRDEVLDIKREAPTVYGRASPTFSI